MHTLTNQLLKVFFTSARAYSLCITFHDLWKCPCWFIYLHILSAMPKKFVYDTNAQPTAPPHSFPLADFLFLPISCMAFEILLSSYYCVVRWWCSCVAHFSLSQMLGRLLIAFHSHHCSSWCLAFTLLAALFFEWMYCRARANIYVYTIYIIYVDQPSTQPCLFFVLHNFPTILLRCHFYTIIKHSPIFE